MAELRFTEEHEWVAVDGDLGIIGISDYAQKQLGDVVYVELPEVGADLAKGDEAAVVESVKAASEVYAPLSGSVVEANEALTDNPALVNEAATSDGWFFKIRLKDINEANSLMDAGAYAAFVAGIE